MFASRLAAALIWPALVLGLAASATVVFADDQKKKDDPKKDDPKHRGMHDEHEQAAKLLRLSKLEEFEVRGRDGKQIGSLDAIAYDSESGKIHYFTVDAGAMASAKAIPWDLASWSPSSRSIFLPLTGQDLEKAEALPEDGAWPREPDRSWLPEQAKRELERKQRQHMDAPGGTLESRGPEADRGPRPDQPGAKKPDQPGAKKPDQPGAKKPDQPGAKQPGAKRPGASDQGVLYPSTRVVGLNVSVPGGDQIGEVDDVIVDVNNGKVAGYVVGAGGILGIGETKLFVPREAIRLQPGDQPGTPESARLRSSRITKREDVRGAPQLDEARLADPVYVERVYLFYQVERDRPRADEREQDPREKEQKKDDPMKQRESDPGDQPRDEDPRDPRRAH